MLNKEEIRYCQLVWIGQKIQILFTHKHCISDSLRYFVGEFLENSFFALAQGMHGFHQ